MHTIFNVFIPSYTHPDGREVAPSDVAVFGAILTENSVDAVAVRDLTLGEVKSALVARWPHLDAVNVRIERSRYKGHTWECDIVPSYCYGG